MRKSLLGAIILCLALSGLAMAHPPSSIEASLREGSLVIIIKHNVANPQDHYISSVKVTSGNKALFEGSYKEQSSKEEHVIEIPVKDMSKPFKITVETICNKWGKLSKDIEIK